MRWRPSAGAAAMCALALMLAGVRAQVTNPPFVREGIEAWNASVRELAQGIQTGRRAGFAGEQPLRDAIRNRKAFLSELMERDPAAALAAALPAETISAIAGVVSGAAGEFESTGEWEGAVRIIDADDFVRGKGRTRWYLQTGEAALELFFTSAAPEAACGGTARVSGMRLGDRLAVSAFSATDTAATGDCAPIGEQRIAVLLAYFPGMSLPPNYTPAAVRDAFFGTASSAAGYWREASYGKVTVTGDVFGPFRLDANYTCDQYDAMRRNAIQAADPTVDFRRYNRLFVLVPGIPGCWWGGLGGRCEPLTAGDGAFTASTSWIAAEAYQLSRHITGIAIHEGGHNFGLGHSYGLGFGTDVLGPVGATATGYLESPGPGWTVQVHWFDQMNQGELAHYSAPHKRTIGWLERGSNWLDIEVDGTFTLEPYEIGTRRPQALRVRRAADSWLWIEYRQPIGYDAGWAARLPELHLDNAYRGVLVHYEDQATSRFPLHAFMLDFTPGSRRDVVYAGEDYTDGALAIGQQWQDRYSPLGLRVSAAPSGGVNVTVSGLGCAAPSIVSHPQNQTVRPGQSATLQVTADARQPFSYQWYEGARGNVNRPVGTNSNVFATPPLAGGTSFWVRVTNNCGSVDSNAATVTVANCDTPAITAQPQDRTIDAGGAATLSITAAGTAPLSYQWYEGSRGETSRPVGGNASSFTTPALTGTASYWVRVSNACGAIDSAAATITVRRGPVPSFLSSSVVNAASGAAGMVPGSLATLYGTGLTTGVAGVVEAGTVPLPATLRGTSVTVGGVAAPITAIASQNGLEQINFQVPWEMAGKASAAVVVSNNGQASSAVDVPVFATQPGVFAVLHADYTPVTRDQPIMASEVLIVYATGLGAVSHRPATGEPAPSQEPLARALEAVGVTAGIPGEVLYAGLAGGFAGLYQVNVRVSDRVPAGNLPLIVMAGRAMSAPFVLPVEGGQEYQEAFLTRTALWHVTEGGGPGGKTVGGAWRGITRAENVLFPRQEARLGTCGAPHTPEFLTLVVPRAGCTEAYTNYQSADGKRWYAGAGGEIQTTAPMHYGRYEIVMQTSREKGAVNGFFIYWPMPGADDANEIDIEVLSFENDEAARTGWVHFTVHLPQKRRITYRHKLPFAPWEAAHKYAFEWRADGIRWFVDDNPVQVAGASLYQGQQLVDERADFNGNDRVPQMPGLLMINHWTNGDEEWSRAAPASDAIMTVRSLAYRP